MKKSSDIKNVLLNRLALWLLHPTKGTFIEQWAEAFGDFSPVKLHYATPTDEQKVEMKLKIGDDTDLLDRLVERIGLPSHHMILPVIEPKHGQLSALWCQKREAIDETLGWTDTTGEVWFPDEDDPDRPVRVRQVVEWVIENIRNLK